MAYSWGLIVEDNQNISAFPAEPFSDPAWPLTVIVLSADPAIRRAMAEALQACCLKAVLADGLAELKSTHLEDKVVACLCGSFVADGTIREIAGYLKNQPVEIPMIIVSAPAPISEYGEFLDSLRVGAFDFICHPYRANEIQLILWSAIQYYCESAKTRTTRANWYMDSIEFLGSCGVLLRDPQRSSSRKDTCARNPAEESV